MNLGIKEQFFVYRMKVIGIQNKKTFMSACQHVALLRFGRPEIESWLADLSRSSPPLTPISLPV